MKTYYQVLIAEKESKIAEMDAASTGEAVRFRASVESVKGELAHLKREHVWIKHSEWLKFIFCKWHWWSLWCEYYYSFHPCCWSLFLFGMPKMSSLIFEMLMNTLLKNQEFVCGVMLHHGWLQMFLDYCWLCTNKFFVEAIQK